MIMHNNAFLSTVFTCLIKWRPNRKLTTLYLVIMILLLRVFVITFYNMLLPKLSLMYGHVERSAAIFVLLFKTKGIPLHKGLKGKMLVHSAMQWAISNRMAIHTILTGVLTSKMFRLRALAAM